MRPESTKSTNPMKPIDPLTRRLTRETRVETTAQQLFYDDVMEGRSTSTFDWDTTPAHEQDFYRGEARAFFRQFDVCAREVAFHRACKAAEAALPSGTIGDIGREALKTVLR